MKFKKGTIGTKIEQKFGYPMEGRKVQLERLDGAVSVKPSSDGDMFSYPYVGLATDEGIEETWAFQNFIGEMLHLKAAPEASPELRQYIRRLIYDELLRQHFLQLPDDEFDEALKSDLPDADDRKALRGMADRLQDKVERFRKGKVVDDGDHLLLFPQTVEKIAPQTWFDAAWPFIARFRSNFGLYLGEALLYSRVTILGHVTCDPAATEQQETFLKRGDSRQVERIAVANAYDLRRVLDWGVAHNVRFGLGGEITEMILDSKPEDTIMATIQTKFGDEMERMAR